MATWACPYPYLLPQLVHIYNIVFTCWIENVYGLKYKTGLSQRDKKNIIDSHWESKRLHAGSTPMGMTRRNRLG